MASHVAEHVPDLITWLDEVRGVLKPDGQLRLALPDCRFSFDVLRDETRFVDVLTNWVLRARRPQVHNVLDFRLHYAPDMDGLGWYEGRFDTDCLKPAHSFEVAISSAESARDRPDQYFDVHCWVFQPRSFAQLMAELADHNLLQLACASLGDTAPPLFEFYVFMRPCDDPALVAQSWRAVQPALCAYERQQAPSVAASLAAQTAKVNELGQELAAARQALSTAQTRIAGLEASTSWRITEPLRRFSSYLRGKPR
jgi:hypothetical protein